MASHHSEPLRQQLLRSLAENGARPRIVRSCDLGNGPHHAFGSALGGKHGANPLAPPPLIGRTVKPRAAGPCSVCGERRFFCDCDNGEAA